MSLNFFFLMYEVVRLVECQKKKKNLEKQRTKRCSPRPLHRNQAVQTHLKPNFYKTLPKKSSPRKGL